MFPKHSGSLFTRIRSWWEYAVLFEPKDWVQIEITSQCNATCAYCPRTVYRKHWQDRYMSMETFCRLLPALRKTSLAYLQGWGEPLLHPDFTTMVKLAKQAGCTVGATSNGMLLTREGLLGIMDAGLDLLAFSLAGTTPARNDQARAGTTLLKVLEKLDLVRQVKEEYRSSTPALHIAYMLLRSGIDELEGLPRLLAKHGVDQAVVSVLDFEPGVDLAKEVLAPQNDQERRELEDLFGKVRAQGLELGVTIHLPSFGVKREDEPVCSENIQQALFVSADGEVSPCVYAKVPVDQAEYARQGRVAPYRQVSFGNIKKDVLPKIWRGSEYANFREHLAQGQSPEICRNCPKRRR